MTCGVATSSHVAGGEHTIAGIPVATSQPIPGTAIAGRIQPSVPTASGSEIYSETYQK
jgi:hypothetical protein